MNTPGTRAASLLALLAVLAFHAHARSKADTELNLADRSLLAVTGPIQAGVSSIGEGSAGILEHYLWLVGTSRENEDLKLELAHSRSSLAELVSLRSENDRLRQLVGLRESAPGRVTAASVIGRGTSSRFHTLRLDRGSERGIEPGMAVVSVAGVVGQILRVSRNYSDILLLTDGLSSAGAVVQKSGIRGLAVGDSSDQLQLSYLRRSDVGSVGVGDLITTSGEDGVFPEGFPVGRVTRAEAPETGLFLDIEIEPVAELDRVEEVLVVLDPGSGLFHLPPPNVLTAWEQDGASIDDEEEL